MQEWKCRECGMSVAGAAHLRFGKQINRGGNAMCLSCTDKLMAKMHTPTIHEFVPKYVRLVQPPRVLKANEMKALQERVLQLEALLTAMGTKQAVITSPTNTFSPPRRAG